MNKRGFILATTGLVLALLIGAIASCGTVERALVIPPMIEGAGFVGNQACAECHADILNRFPGSPHGQYHKEGLEWAPHSGCESCHGPASKHVQALVDKASFIVNPGKDPASCFQCHRDVHAEFRLPNSHPVIEHRMNCVDCHDPHGGDIFKPSGGLAMARLNESCAECHREQSRMVIYEHEALREGCVVCHNPHGSVNDKLLVERDQNLCLKCHSQMQGGGIPGGEIYIGKVAHSALLSQGTCWSAGCHTAVHGSNVNPKMLY